MLKCLLSAFTLENMRMCEYHRKISLTPLTKVEGEAITVPATMMDKLETWLQHDQSLLATADRQRVIHITNKEGNQTFPHGM